MAETTAQRDEQDSVYPTLAAIIAASLSFILGLALTRVIYEGLFPRLLWLGRPLPIMAFALLSTVLGFLFWRRLSDRIQDKAYPTPIVQSNQATWIATVVFLPLIINLFYLISSQVDLAASRFLFFSSLWLVILFLSRLLIKPAIWRWLSIVMIIIYLAPIYLLTMSHTVGQADTFEFQVVVPQLGIAHPTGYPLYLLLTKLFTFLPLDSMAWRVNLASSVYGLASVILLYILGRRLAGWEMSSLLAAVMLGLTPIFWSQAIQAEVYSLHALIVLAALLLMREVGDWRLLGYQPVKNKGSGEVVVASTDGITESSRPYYLTVALVFVLGLGLTHHLTIVLMLPAAAFTIFFAYRVGRYKGLPINGTLAILLILAAMLLPLLLYLYLPLRWAAVNGEPMGISRFIDWVIGGRFQGALQLNAWLKDLTRYDIVGRLLAHEWSYLWSLVLIVVGGVYLFLWQWRFALILFVTWLGFVFYALNYYVPDLAVFLIPAQLIFAIWWLCGLVAALDLVRGKPDSANHTTYEIVIILAAIIPLLVAAANYSWKDVDRSVDDGRTLWAESVLELPLPDGTTILADSDKYPALYYLQQSEGLRPDLEIMVLPDEAAYRTQLGSSLSAGQPLFLARYLPGLEGIYHLNSNGPLIRVSEEPLESIPTGSVHAELDLGTMKLVGYSIQTESPYKDGESAVTFYWQADAVQDQVLLVYVRWVGDGYIGPISFQHPANNTYPTVAWETGEIVADYHSLPRPMVNEPTNLDLQVALAPPFTAVQELTWQKVTSTTFVPLTDTAQVEQRRSQIGPTLVDGISFPHQARPEAEFPVSLSGFGPNLNQLELTFRPTGAGLPSTSVSRDDAQVDRRSLEVRSIHTHFMTAPDTAGRYDLVVSHPRNNAICGWLSSKKAGCYLGEIEIVGSPLPEGATNFEDKIALLSLDLPQDYLDPGGQLGLSLTWTALSPLAEDYTVFVQVLDEKDRIVGQVDSWPVQGTLPTRQWETGQIIDDPYLIQLDDNLPPGNFRLIVGWYLLETLRRLPVLDQNGSIVDDKVIVPGLVVPEP